MTGVMWWVLTLILSPLLVGLLADAVPGGRVLIPALIVLGALRLALVLFVGSRAADYAIGKLAYDVIALPFRAVAMLFVLALRASRAGR